MSTLTGVSPHLSRLDPDRVKMFNTLVHDWLSCSGRVHHGEWRRRTRPRPLCVRAHWSPVRWTRGALYVLQSHWGWDTDPGPAFICTFKRCIADLSQSVKQSARVLWRYHRTWPKSMEILQYFFDNDIQNNRLIHSSSFVRHIWCCSAITHTQFFPETHIGFNFKHIN